MDTISDNGKSVLFARDIIQVTELTEEVLTHVLPGILFLLSTPHALGLFAETFAAHSSVCNVVPELHVEIDFTKDMSEEDLEKLDSRVTNLLNFLRPLTSDGPVS